MSIPRTVSDVLRQHLTMEVEGIDRMYLNVYVPALQRAGGVATFFGFHLGHQFASSVGDSALRGAFDRLQAEIDRCCEEQKLVA
jgi:hypothetical protein